MQLEPLYFICVIILMFTHPQLVITKTRLSLTRPDLNSTSWSGSRPCSGSWMSVDHSEDLRSRYRRSGSVWREAACLPLATPASAAEQEERGLVVEDDLSGSVPARGVNQPSQCFTVPGEGPY